MPRIAQLEQSVPTIPTVFATNPKEDVVNATYGSSQKIWQNKADFDSKVPPVVKAIADAKGKIKDAASLKVAYDSINGKCNDCHETYRAQAEIAAGSRFGLLVEQARQQCRLGHRANRHRLIAAANGNLGSRQPVRCNTGALVNFFRDDRRCNCAPSSYPASRAATLTGSPSAVNTVWSRKPMSPMMTSPP